MPVIERDRWGCRADYEAEQIAEAERQAHDDGACEGAPMCLYCVDEQETGESSLA